MSLDDDASRRGGTPLIAAAKRSFALLFLASTVVLSYHLLFQVTKPSPVSAELSWGGLSPVLGYSVLVVLGLTLACLPVALSADLLWRRRTGREEPLGSLTVTAGIYALGTLALLENLLYTVVGLGLKTDDSVTLKVGYVLAAVSLGTLCARFAGRVSHRIVTRLLRTVLVLVVPAAALVAQDAATTNAEPPALEPTATPNLVNVLILSSDGIESNHMSVYGYARRTTPFLDSKKAEFRLFENAFTNNGNTTGSITSLLTGRSPIDTGVVYPPDLLDKEAALRTLPYLLGHFGYYRSNWAVPHYADAHDQNLVRAFEMDNGDHASTSITGQLPLGTGLARWFITETLQDTWRLLLDATNIKELDNSYVQVSTANGDTLGDEARLAAVIDEIGRQSRFFINTHFMVTHGPGFEVDTPHFSRGLTQTRGWQRDFYDDSILQFDKYIRRIYGQLARTGKLDSTILVVTSDHGINKDASARVPLMIRFPARTPRGSTDVNAQRLDIAPTVLDVLGLRQPAWMVGTSLLHAEQLPLDRQFTATNTGTRVVLNGGAYHLRDGALIYTTVRCDSYVRLYPTGQVERGHITGSTANCYEKPEIASVGGTGSAGVSITTR